MAFLIESVRKFRNAADPQTRSEAASEIIVEVGPELFYYASRACEPEMVKDVHQETLIKIATNLKSFLAETDGQFRAWCYTILRRTIWNMTRRNNFYRFEPFDEDGLHDTLFAKKSGLSPEEKLDLEYALSIVEAVKKDCRRLLWHYHVLDWDYDMIAEAAGKTYDAVRVEIKRCLELAQSLVEKMKAHETF